MNKLNTFLSFVLLSFCLLINVSSAKVFNNVTGTVNSIEFNELVANSINPTELTERDSYIINSAIEYLTKNNLYDPTNYSYYFVRNTSNSLYKIYRHPISNARNPIYVMGQPYNNNMRYNLSSDYAYVSSIVLDNSNNFSYCSDFTLNTNSYNLYLAYYDTTSTTLYTYDDITTAISSVDLALYTSNSDFGFVYYQQYTSYAKQNPSISVVNNYYMYGTAPDEPSPDEPIMPTNSEIASVVQSFYDSDLYKNNTNFKEFFVLYNSLKGIYSFVGHNSVGEIANHFEYGSTLSQHIYYDDYPSNIYGVTYWHFDLETLGSQISNIFNNYYWLYSTNNNGETIIYDGKGYITDLIEIKFDPTYSTIVYSSTDYLCRIYDYENEEETKTDATIPGDEYTYDENLDPTTNNYNPIKDYVPINPSETILGNADFEGFMSIFNENKEYVILPSNANWIILANNSLFNHFSSFIIMCTIFIIIERFMRG